jgi:peptide/nickel transport system permease protein
MLLILLVAVPLESIPSSGRSGIASLILPSVTIGVYFAARIARITRTSVLEFLGQDFVNTARSKGASEARVVIVHVLRNAATTIVTVVGYLFATVMSGAIVTEAVFGWPGLGSLMIQSVRERDFPVVQASVFVVAMFVIAVNVIADLAIAALDPRIRLK